MFISAIMSNHVSICVIKGIDRDQLTGEHVAFQEVDSLPSDAVVTNSTSIHRQPGEKSAFVFGSSTNYPFAPGGLESMEIG